jgi:hypothetical protein
MAMLIRALTNPQTFSEQQGFSHFSASRIDSLFFSVAEGTISRNHEWGEVPTLLKASPKMFLLILALMGC